MLTLLIRILRVRYIRRHRRWASTGACMRCGYDRGGLAADAKCPECGTVPALPSE